MKAIFGFVVAATVLTAGAVAMAADRQSRGSGPVEGQGRIGIGMNLDSAEATYSLDTRGAIGVGLNFDITSGDYDSSGIGFKAWYQSALKSSEAGRFLVLGGLGYGSDSTGDDMSTSGFVIFGGIGAEYFLPGTKSFSIEAKVGLLIEFLSQEMTMTVPTILGPITSTAKASGTRIGIGSLSGAMVILRYYLN